MAKKKGSLNSFDSSLRWICPLPKETLVPLYFASLLHDFYEEEKKNPFTGICAIFDLNCHVVDQTVYCINK